MRRTMWFWSVPAVSVLGLALMAPSTAAAGGQPGGQSIGDPYFQHEGNTGYEVDNYALDLSYQPGADQLSGTATISATTTQDLSSFSFDFGLDASAVKVDDATADFKTEDDKLIITPKAAVPAHQSMK